MRSIAVNGKNDIYLGADGNLAMAVDLDAVSQGCEHAMKTQYQECVLNLSVGVKTLDTIWNDYKPQQFEASARKNLALVPNVTGVRTFNVEQVGDEANYTAEIASTYGPIAIAGDLAK